MSIALQEISSQLSMLNGMKYAKAPRKKADKNRMEVYYTTEEFTAYCEEIQQLRDIMKNAEKREKELVRTIVEKMGDKTLLCNDDGEVLAEYKPWKPEQKIKLKDIEEQAPSLYQDLVKDWGYVTIRRPFKVKIK